MSIKDFLLSQDALLKLTPKQLSDPPTQTFTWVTYTASRDVGSSAQLLAPQLSPSSLDFLRGR